MAMIDCLLVNAAIADLRNAGVDAEMFKLGYGFDAYYAADGFYTVSTHEDRDVAVINFRAGRDVAYSPYFLNRFGTAAA